MIHFNDITKEYQMGTNRFLALKGISFSIEEGEYVAIIGPSGSGKSTAMNIMGMLDRPTSGTYSLLGHEVSNLTRVQQAEYRNEFIGFIFQSFCLLSKLTAVQNVGLPLMYRRDKQENIEHRCLDVLEQVGLGGEHSYHRPNELSGGQRQRVAIARALVGDPKLILADEPTGALDSKTGKNVMNMLESFNREKGVTVVVITHDIEIADQCDRTITIRDGLLE